MPISGARSLTITSKKIMIEACDAAFTPLDLTNLIVWLDASVSASIIHGTADPDASQWDDLSGNSNNVSTANPVDEPEELVGAQNGLNILEFDGVDENLGRSGFTGGAISQPNTIYLAMDIRDTTQGYFLDGGTSSFRHALFNDSVQDFLLFAGGTLDTDGTVSTGFAIYRIEFNTTSSKLFKNNVQIGLTGDPGSHTMKGIWLASIATTGAVNGHVRIGEVIVVNELHNSVENLDTHNYLTNKWIP